MPYLMALAEPPKRGRPPAVQALNKAAIALLSAHLQGFVADLHEEAARKLLGPHVVDIDELVKSAAMRGNPRVEEINRLFATIGIKKVADRLRWQKCNNQAVKRKLTSFLKLRNDIVHGKAGDVRKSTVEQYLRSWKVLAEKLESEVTKSIKKKTGSHPW